ncbi:ATP-binding protein [Streptomyces kanasensis]|uniref:ATP-binding protein n=1 Tax=Streptomyces kanasensis TaxID=936756 RepID=UPI00380755F0
METAFRRSFAGLSLLFSLVWWLTAVSLAVSDDRRPSLVAAAALFAGSATVWAYRGAFVRVGPVDAWSAVAVAVVVHTACALHRSAELVVGLRCMVTTAAVLLAVAYLPGVRGRAAAVAALAAQVVAGWEEGAGTALEGIWPAFAGGVAAAVLAPVLRTAGDRADIALREDEDASEAAARERAARRSRREFQRLLHDDVGSALRAAGMSGVTAGERRAEARRAVAALTSGAVGAAGTSGGDGAAGGNGAGDGVGVADLVPLLTGLTATSVGGVPRPRVTTDFPAELTVPREVAAACAGAAVEALRNVRYAGAAHVVVRLRGDHRGLELTVADDGRGFVPSQVRRTALGLRDSVGRRMADVGGVADVRSRPGHGTTVTLRWSAPAPDAHGDRGPRRPRGQQETLRAAVGDVRGGLAAVCLPHLGVMAVVAVVQTAGTPALLGHLVWYLALAGATCLLLLRADRRISGRVAVPLLVVAVAGAVSCLRVIPPEAVTDYRSWPIGAVSPLLTLLVIVRPVRQTLLALACEEAGVAVLIAMDPPVAGSAAGSVVMALPAMLAPATGVVMGLVIRRTLVTLGGAVLDAHRHRMVVVATESAARARAEQHRRRLREIDTQIVPFLRAVAADDGPGPTAVRARADRLAQSLRDELHLPGVLDGPLRDLVGRAREAGCEVTIHARADDDTAPAETPARTALLRAVLTAALADLSTPDELVLGVQDGPAGPTLSVVTMPGDPRRAAALGAVLAGEPHTLEDSAELTWAEVVLPE